MSSGVPRMCMITAPAPASATASTMPGALRPPTSLTTTAPAARAARATAALRVSMLTWTPRATRASTTGTVRASSSATPTSAAPGRVDSPPTSTQLAPCSQSWRPRAMAASRLACSPPSEKLSGVTLRMPTSRRAAPGAR